MDRYEKINENIALYGNRGGRYTPMIYDVFYPLYSQDFIRTGFQTICPTLSARDYKDPKRVLVKRCKKDFLDKH